VEAGVTRRYSDGALLTGIANAYETMSYGDAPARFPKLVEKVETLFDGDDTGTQMATRFLYDDFGNITARLLEGDITVASDERYEYTTHADCNRDRWIMDRPVRTSITDGTSTLFAETRYGYDGGNPGDPRQACPRGNLTAREEWLAQGQSPLTRYGYDAYGNLVSVTDPRGNVTAMTYDAETQTHVASMRNPLGHAVATTYDLRFGTPGTVTDANGDMTITSYDAFGRLAAVTQPDDASPSLTYAYHDTAPAGGERVTVTKDPGSGSSPIVQRISLDGLGRVTLLRSDGPSGTICTVKGYNTRGFLAWASLPYFEAEGRQDCTPEQGEEISRVTTAYDPLGRVIATTLPDGAATLTDYYRRRTTITDARGHRKVEQKDAHGRLVLVEEHAGNPDPAVTTYRYDPPGNLVEVKDALGHTTTVSYDSLSRKVAMSDMDMGRWTYAYDGSGNLAARTDARGRTVTFEYDGINRVTRKSYPTSSITYTYDDPSRPHALGRLSCVRDLSGGTEFSYDARGRITRTDKTIDTALFTTLFTYDGLDRVRTMTYPAQSPLTVSYTYDGAGNLACVYEGAYTPLCPSNAYVTYSNHLASGQAGRVSYGNGVVSDYT